MEQLIVKDYRIIDLVGQGGMAKVYLAEHKSLGHKVAIKVLNKEYFHNDNIRKRFLAEARNLAQMNHPNIVRVTDLIEETESAAFVMEHIEGRTLREYLEEKGKLQDEEIKHLFGQMLDAVGYVHEKGLIHRDIKPSNFMLDGRGNIKLLDFGIAKAADSTSADYTQTGTGVQMGTPMYMSPEQITETKKVTTQSDIYSLGVLLWEMVTGTKPYDSKALSQWQLKTRIVQESLEPTGRHWDNHIKKATQKEIEKRYNYCSELKNEILHVPNAAPLDFANFQFELGTKLQKIEVSDESTLLTESLDDVTEINESVKKDRKNLINEVFIGNQIWMTENLNTEKFCNGDLIFQARTNEEWRIAGLNKQAAWCYYDNDPVNGSKYGKLYNWYAVSDSRSLAPEGWHIPTFQEYAKLISLLDGDEVAAGKMKSATGWYENGNGTNSCGFSALPGGLRGFEGAFDAIGANGNWWTFTEESPSDAWYVSINYFDNFSYKGFNDNGSGFAIRCIRNLNTSNCLKFLNT
jgi:uncharacterized protein (TIGR02145 family)